MTRQHTPQLAQVITEGSFQLEMVGDVYLGAQRLIEGVPLDDWTLTGDYDAAVKTGAKCTIAYQGDFAESYTPREAGDALAPYGQEIHLFAVVTAGGFTERVRAGVYRIDDVPNSRDEVMRVGDRKLTIGSIVSLDLIDRSDAVNTLSRSLEQPASLSSVWAEIVRVSRLQVTRTVADVAIPNSVVYARNRLETVQQLAGLLQGRAVMRSDGTLGVVPDVIGTPAITLSTGEPAGTIIGDEYSLSTRQLANVVIGDFEDDDGRAIHSEAAITSGPLSVLGPFGERVVEYPQDQKQFIRTQATADRATRNHLAKVSTRGPREIPVTLVPDIRLEIGDAVRLERADGTVDGRVVKYSLPRMGAMQVTVRADA